MGDWKIKNWRARLLSMIQNGSVYNLGRKIFFTERSVTNDTGYHSFINVIKNVLCFKSLLS